ncbi:MAG TPA: DUF2288 family protein [Deferrisomatales bacterium]|nr:DUF2288 family protein [Deferrisomatales bacterium]
MSETIRETFENDLAVVPWREVRAHVARDSVILVDPRLDLVDVAVAVAGDDTGRVGPWIAEGRLTKPDQEQLDALATRPATPFRLLIARPFLLVQEVVTD